MEQNGIGFTRVTGSMIINEGPTLLFGLLHRPTVAADGIDLYEGTDAVAGRLITSVKGVIIVTQALLFAQPVYLDRGLYVVLAATVTEATILWLPAGKG